jgi:uncharacterized protein (DUF3084 family)
MQLGPAQQSRTIARRRELEANMRPAALRLWRLGSASRRTQRMVRLLKERRAPATRSLLA